MGPRNSIKNDAWKGQKDEVSNEISESSATQENTSGSSETLSGHWDTKAVYQVTTLYGILKKRKKHMQKYIVVFADTASR